MRNEKNYVIEKMSTHDNVMLRLKFVIYIPGK